MAAGQVTYKFVDDVPAAPSSYKFVDELKVEASKTLPANAGLANFAANIAGLPADTVQSGINLIRAAQGGMAGLAQKAGVPGATDWMPPLLQGSPGTSEWIKGQLRGTEQPGLSPDNPSNSPMGRAQFDLMSRGGFLPGGALPAVGSVVAERTLGPEWAGVGAMTPQAAITGYNAMRAPSLARQESQNAVRDKTFEEGRQEGLVAPPSAAGGGFFSNILESFGGKAATNQKANKINQEALTAIARREAGLPENAAISVEALEARRNVLAQPYREVAALSKEASSALSKLREVRNEATQYFREYDVSQRVAALKKAQKLQQESLALEKFLENEAMRSSRPNLIPELRSARTAIAKTYDIERALNIGTGDVSAPVLGRMMDKGKMLTGGLATAGRFQQAFPQVMREGAVVPSPDVSATNMMAAGALGYGGFQAAGWPGLLAAGIPFARGGARAAMLSGPAQNSLVADYGPAMRPAPSPQLLYQLGILQQP
jgi:hypothetical protein